MQDKDNILYYPELDYDKNYDSIGPLNEENIIEDEEGESKPVIDQLKDKVDAISKLDIFVPNDMKNIIKAPLNVIQIILPTLDNIDELPVRDKQTITVKKDDTTIPEVPPTIGDNSFFRNEDDPYEIIQVNKDKVTVIKDKYQYDLVSVISDYTTKINDISNNYLQSIAPLLSHLTAESRPKVLESYKVYTKDINKDYKHLSDMIVRSQLTRKMKAKMYEKMFNIDRTIDHLRACKIALEQKVRYYEAAYQTDSSRTSAISNVLLENSRRLYDQKYKQNFLNLYKYLNSSVIVLGECMELLINEIQAKTILLKKEGESLW